MMGPIAEYIPGRPPAYGPHGYLTRKDNTGAFGPVRLPFHGLPDGELPTTKIFDPEAKTYVPGALRNHTNTTAFSPAPEKTYEEQCREWKAEVDLWFAKKGPAPHPDVLRAVMSHEYGPKREK